MLWLPDYIKQAGDDAGFKDEEVGDKVDGGIEVVDLKHSMKHKHIAFKLN